MIEWKKIPGFSKYSASSNGEIRLDVVHFGKQPGIMTARMKGEYLHLNLQHDWGFSASVPVHRLVAFAFYGKPTAEKPMVLHGDGNSVNNAARNLRYGTAKENTEDQYRHGTNICGRKAHSAKLSDSDIPKIQQLLTEQKMTQSEIAEMFGVSQRAIWQIASGKKWRHVTGGKKTPTAKSGYRKLNDFQVVEIRKRKLDGERVSVLAAEYGVSVSNIYKIVSGASRLLHPEHQGLFEFRVRKAPRINVRSDNREAA